MKNTLHHNNLIVISTYYTLWTSLIDILSMQTYFKYAIIDS